MDVLWKLENTPIFQCTRCYFCLHVQCCQVLKVVEHNFHPPHPLSLLDAALHFESNNLSCVACLMTIKGGFYLHCTDCPSDLHLGCSFLKHEAKHGLHDGHPLAYFDKIYAYEVPCAACHTLCTRDLFRCFNCNFNIHKECFSLPFSVIIMTMCILSLCLVHSKKMMVIISVVFVEREEIQIMVFIYVKNVSLLLILNALFL